MLEIQRMVKDYKLDRPVMNKTDTLPRLISLLREEVDEFEAEPSGQELADILFVALCLANDMGLCADKEVREKLVFNALRYESRFFQEGDYEEARRKSKANEVQIKAEFYETSNPPLLISDPKI